MADVAPENWLPYGFNGGTNTISLSTNPVGSGGLGISDTDAFEDTGDIRKVMLAIIQCVYGYYLQSTPPDTPTKMKIESRGQETPAGLTRTYTFTFNLSRSGEGVVAE